MDAMGTMHAAQLLIDRYNDEYAKVFAAVRRKQRDVALRRDVELFLSGSRGFNELFRGVTFGDDGKLPRELILANLARIRASRKLAVLHPALSELLDFILFSAMGSMDRSQEQALEREVGEILTAAGDPGSSRSR